MLVFILKHCFEYPGKSMKGKIDWITCLGRNSSWPFGKLKEAIIIEDGFLFLKKSSTAKWRNFNMQNIN